MGDDKDKRCSDEDVIKYLKECLCKDKSDECDRLRDELNRVKLERDNLKRMLDHCCGRAKETSDRIRKLEEELERTRAFLAEACPRQ